MSRSFSIDLNQYRVYRTIGDGKEVLSTQSDRSDLIACLEALGYTNISEASCTGKRFGDIFNLEDVLTHETIGIPTSAQVDVMKTHRLGNSYHLTFTY